MVNLFGNGLCGLLFSCWLSTLDVGSLRRECSSGEDVWVCPLQMRIRWQVRNVRLTGDVVDECPIRCSLLIDLQYVSFPILNRIKLPEEEICDGVLCHRVIYFWYLARHIENIEQRRWERRQENFTFPSLPYDFSTARRAPKFRHTSRHGSPIQCHVVRFRIERQ